MNKIRKYLIHLLGGVTKEELSRSTGYAVWSTGFHALHKVLRFMKYRYGMPADEWCKTVYGYVYEIHEIAEKELEAFLKANPECRNGGK